MSSESKCFPLSSTCYCCHGFESRTLRSVLLSSPCSLTAFSRSRKSVVRLVAQRVVTLLISLGADVCTTDETAWFDVWPKRLAPLPMHLAVANVRYTDGVHRQRPSRTRDLLRGRRQQIWKEEEWKREFMGGRSSLVAWLSKVAGHIAHFESTGTRLTTITSLRRS